VIFYPLYKLGKQYKRTSLGCQSYIDYYGPSTYINWENNINWEASYEKDLLQMILEGAKVTLTIMAHQQIVFMTISLWIIAKTYTLLVMRPLPSQPHGA
jgi:hypothetical protein